MATQEFYIRSATETDARGPFTQDQLASLAENGQIDAETLYYEANTETWVTVRSNAPLLAFLFPEKKRLKTKVRDNVKTLNTVNENAAPLSVEDMLAAAEGRTADTKDRRDPRIAQARAAKIGMIAATVTLVINVAAFILPSIDVIVALDFAKLLYLPIVILGAVDLFLALMMFLQVVQVYPFIRFRAMLGLGLMGFIYWSQGQINYAATAVASALGLYLCTVFVSYSGIFVATVLAVGGAGAYAYLALN